MTEKNRRKPEIIPVNEIKQGDWLWVVGEPECDEEEEDLVCNDLVEVLGLYAGADGLCAEVWHKDVVDPTRTTISRFHEDSRVVVFRGSNLELEEGGDDD